MTTEITPAPAAPAATPTPAEAKPETKVEAKPDDVEALRRESLKAAREAREAREALKRYEAKDRERAQAEEARKREREAEDALRDKDPGAWLERRAGMTRAELAAKLKGQQADPASKLERELAALREELAAEKAARVETLTKAQQQSAEAAQANAYRTVMQAAKGSEDFALAVESMKESPKAAAKWIADWAEKEWPQVAEAEGLDATDPAEAAKACAKAIAGRELARLQKLVQNPSIAKALGLGAQSQQPPASQGTKPPTTLTANLAAERSTGTPDNRPLLGYEQEAIFRKNAERKALELMAARKG